MATRPKIKKDLPKKQAKPEMVVTKEKVGAPIEEDFIRPELKEGETTVIHDPSGLLKHPTPEKVIEEVNKEIDAGTIAQDDTTKPKPEKVAAGEAWNPVGQPDDNTLKEAQPDKYPSPAGKAEQPFLFGEADQILNALDTELTQWNRTHSKLGDARDKLGEKIDAAMERITTLASAILATKKHAPMTYDPAPPEQIKKTAVVTVFRDADKPGLKIHVEEEDPTKDQGTDEQKEADKDLAPKNEIEGAAQKEKKTVAKGAAERNQETESKGPKFRTGTLPVPEYLFLGDVVDTSWKSAGPYRVDHISGPFMAVEMQGEAIPSPGHYTLKCSEVGAKRNKDGKLPSDYEYSYMNMVVAVSDPTNEAVIRFVSVFEESPDEIFLVSDGVDKKKAEAPKQEALPETQQADGEDLY